MLIGFVQRIDGNNVEDKLSDREIREQLERILGSNTFRDSLRLTRFLTFVVDTTLAGRRERIKAYTVAVEALGRKTDFDPQSNAIVRVEAGRLRDALARYYAGGGANDAVIIDMPRGAYVPAFRRNDLQGAKPPPPAAQSMELKRQLGAAVEVAGNAQQLGRRVAEFRELALTQRERLTAFKQEIRASERALKRCRQLLNDTVALKLASHPPSSPAPSSRSGAPALASETSLAANSDGPGAAFRMLDDLTAQLLVCSDLKSALDAVLDAAISLQRSDFGNVQLFDDRIGRLIICAQHGFDETFLNRFAQVGGEDRTACARALQTRAPVIVPDVDRDPERSSLRSLAAAAGYRAVQSTPLIATSGKLVGVVSTHFARPHAPSRHDMLLTQLYARLAADVIARLTPGEPDALTDWACSAA
jgi:GAF domain